MRPGSSNTVLDSPRAQALDLKNAQGFVLHLETLGKGVAAILVAGVLVAAFLAAAAWTRSNDTAESIVTRIDDERVRIEQAETEARMLEYYVMELDGKLMAQGIIDPAESWSAQKKARQSASKEAKQ